MTANNVESGMGGWKSVARHQAEQADSILPIEAVKYSANTIADVSRQYTGKVWDRDQYATRHFSVIRRVKKSEAIEDTRLRLAAIPSEKRDLVRWRLGRIEFKQYEKYDGFALKVFPT